MENKLLTQFQDIIDSIQLRGLEEEPSIWSGKHRRLSSDISTIQGMFSYDLVPYLREVVDNLSPYNSSRVIAVMKGSQVGFTEGVIINGITWLIANNPGNIILTSANDDLSKEIIESRLDQAITVTGIRHLIKPNTIRKRNQRTGDTSNHKEFTGGRLFAGGINSINKLSRQRSIKYGFFDDWDAAPISDKVQGNLFDILQKRFSTAKNSMKQFYISTPETKPSNIEQVYLKGDQRHWKVPCPICGAYIELKWTDTDEKGERVGILYDVDELGNLIENSVRYKCQECKGEFTEKEKYKMNLQGIWVSTAKAQRNGYISYWMPNLIAAPFMFGWKDFCYDWIDIHRDGNIKKNKLKVFMNQTLGLPWEEKKSEIKGNKLAENTRNYAIGIIPRELSIKDGNGDILLLTCACDLNGTLDDARMDYEVVAHAKNGNIYAIQHGSIGTYKAGFPDHEREKWTYKNGAVNNVWDYFYNEIINIDYYADDDTTMRIMMTAIDTGYYTHFAYSFVDQFSSGVIGVKGNLNSNTNKFQKIGHDLPLFKPARERPRLYILEVERIKDELGERMELVWLNKDLTQPQGFINFPEPRDGKYTFSSYFKQYEAEEKIIQQDEDGEPIGWKWVRKHSSMANHYFDTMVYNLAARDIFANLFCKEVKKKSGTWSDFVEILEN